MAQCTTCSYADREVAALRSELEVVARDLSQSELSHIPELVERINRISQNLSAAVDLYNHHYLHAHQGVDRLLERINF